MDLRNLKIEDVAAAAGITPMTHPPYRADLWQVVTDGFGYESVHETNEDGKPGDLVAHIMNTDHTALILAAPDLFAALEHVLNGALSLPRFAEAEGRAALAKARGKR